jgi:hypothetical protein
MDKEPTNDETERYSIIKNCINSSMTVLHMTSYVLRRVWLNVTFILCPFPSPPAGTVFEAPSDRDFDSDEDVDIPDNEKN